MKSRRGSWVGKVATARNDELRHQNMQLRRENEALQSWCLWQADRITHLEGAACALPGKRKAVRP